MEIDVNPTPTRKRPDVIQRLKDRKGKQERVIMTDNRYQQSLYLYVSSTWNVACSDYTYLQ